MVRKKSIVRYLPIEDLNKLREDVHSWSEAADKILLNPRIQEFNPEEYTIDPRGGELLVYASSRNKRQKKSPIEK